MVIRNKNREAQISCMLKLIYGGYAVVAGENNVNPVFFCLIDDIDIDSVAILYTIRKNVVNNRTQSFQTFNENVGCTNSVNVIVTVDNYFFVVADGYDIKG